MPRAIHEAAAAIVALINASPRSPCQDEIEKILARLSPAPVPETLMSDLRIRLRKAMARSDAALDVVCKLPAGAEYDMAQAELYRWEDEIRAMEAEIPTPRAASRISSRALRSPVMGVM